MAIVPQVAVIAFTASQTWAIPFAADQTLAAIAFATDHTWAVIALVANQTSAATLVPNQTQAVVAMVASHTLVAVALVVPQTQAVVALVTNHTQAIAAQVVVMGIFDPTWAGMVGKAIIAAVVDQTNEDDRARQAQILTSQSLDLDKQATLMQDHSKKVADTMVVLKLSQGSQLAMVMDIAALAIQATIMATLEDESVELAITMATIEDESVELAIAIDEQVVELAINLVPNLA